VKPNVAISGARYTVALPVFEVSPRWDRLITSSFLGRYHTIAAAEIIISKYRSVGFFPRRNRTRPKTPILSDIAHAKIMADAYF
jgi:hypothetical protein